MKDTYKTSKSSREYGYVLCSWHFRSFPALFLTFQFRISYTHRRNLTRILNQYSKMEVCPWPTKQVYNKIWKGENKHPCPVGSDSFNTPTGSNLHWNVGKLWSYCPWFSSWFYNFLQHNLSLLRQRRASSSFSSFWFLSFKIWILFWFRYNSVYESKPSVCRKSVSWFFRSSVFNTLK